MSLDVVVVTHDSAAFLPRALVGLPSQARVIVVDNASTDGSAEVARSLGAEVVENPVNAGFAAAVNRGVALGTADAVLLLNPDAEVGEEVVERLVARLAEEPGLAVTSPRIVGPDGTDAQAWWPFPSAPAAWREALGLHRLAPRTGGEGFVIGAVFMVRRAAFEQLGGLDERYWLYGEETDLCRRALDAGWRVELADDLVARHVGGASGEGLGDLVFEHFHRGGEHFVSTHSGRAALVSYRLANLVGSAARAVIPGPADRRSLHRRRARRLLQALRRPTTVELDSPATTAAGEGLVVCSLEAWDDVWRRNQFLVRELLRLDPNRRVLFVEPPYDHLLEARHRRGRARRRGLSPVPEDGRIVRFEPGKVWPRLLGAAADRSLRRQVRGAARQLGLDPPVLWVNDPHYAGLAGETGWPSLYDVTDDWTEAGGPARFTRRVRDAEAELMAECGAVVVCSDGLATSRREARPDLVVVPNAVDVDHFRRPRPRPDDLPAAPVAVYVGTLHDDRIDVDLLERLARARPDLHLALVGPDSLSPTSRARLAAIPSVQLLGPRPYARVPSYLQHADVVIVPHVVSPFTESLDPIKAYECLAVGRPTVATPVAGFRGLPAPIRCADPSSFVAAVGEALGAPAPAGPPGDVATWADRARAFADALDRAVRSGRGARPGRGTAGHTGRRTLR